MSVRVLGIDPGSRITGYGLVDCAEKPRSAPPVYVASGCVKPKSKVFPERLAEIYRGVSQLIVQYEPQMLSIEEVFLARNPQSALKLGQARGVAIAAAVAHNLPVAEYAARRVKQVVVGTGGASKSQVQHMVRVLLNLPAAPSEDASDALAIAICHVNTVRP